MSDAFWKRLSLLTGLIVLAAIFGLMVFVANIEIKDLDLWLHMGMGKYIVQHGLHVPKVDILSCTIAGKPWINHEWLFQIIVYEIFKHSGAEGLLNFQVILVALTMLVLLILGYNNKKQLASLFILLLVSLVYQGRFTNRPDLFSLFFFAFYILMLSFYIGKRWSIYALFVAQVLWSNIHGFFFFGPLFVLIGIVSEWLKRHIPLPWEWNKTGRLTDEEFRRLKMIFVLVILACLFNPCTVKGAWYPVSIFFQISGKSRIFFQNIVELQKPIVWGTLFSFDHYPYYKLLIILSFLSFVFNRRKIDVSGLIVWLVFLFFSLAAVRNMIFFAFAAYLVFVTNALTISLRDMVPIRISDKKFIHILSITAKILLLVWILRFGSAVSMNGYFDLDTFEWKSEFGGISQRGYPYRAVDFLADNNIQGNFLNGFNTGAYLIGRCFPDIKVFIDGRTEVYGPDFFKYYRDLWETPTPEDVAKTLRRYRITGIFLHAVNHPVPEKMARIIHDHHKEFIPVYLDFDGMIFLKDIPQNQAVINKYRLDLDHWEAYPTDLLKLGVRKVPPIRNYRRAYALESLGYDEGALAELNYVLKITPGYDQAYKLKGKIYADLKDHRRAFENFRIAAMFNPHSFVNRKNLAMSYEDLGEYDYAAEQYQKIIAKWPNRGEGYFKLARALIKQKKFNEAVETLAQALTVVGDGKDDVMALSDMMMLEGAYAQAQQVLLLIAQKDQGLEVRRRLGQVYLATGEKEKAVEEFTEALKLDPGNAELNQMLTSAGEE